MAVKQTKDTIPQEFVKLIPPLPKESFPSPLVEGTHGYLWCLSAYVRTCWSLGPLSTTRTCYAFQSPCGHPGSSHPAPYPKFLQLVGFPPPAIQSPHNHAISAIHSPGFPLPTSSVFFSHFPCCPLPLNSCPDCRLRPVYYLLSSLDPSRCLWLYLPSCLQ